MGTNFRAFLGSTYSMNSNEYNYRETDKLLFCGIYPIIFLEYPIMKSKSIYRYRIIIVDGV